MINWPMLINELKRSGVSLWKISEDAKCDRKTVRRLRDVPGGDPRYSLGACLLEIGRKHLSPDVFKRICGDVPESRGSCEEHY